MSFEDFKDGHQGGHLGYQNRNFLASLSLHVAPMPPTNLRLNGTIGRRCRLKIFKKCCRTGYWNKMILTILNHHVAPMPLTKFQLNLTRFKRRSF